MALARSFFSFLLSSQYIYMHKSLCSSWESKTLTEILIEPVCQKCHLANSQGRCSRGLCSSVSKGWRLRAAFSTFVPSVKSRASKLTAFPGWPADRRCRLGNSLGHCLRFSWNTVPIHSPRKMKETRWSNLPMDMYKYEYWSEEDEYNPEEY